ncbi:hypothetical protein B6S12_09435 [Helicobacter valdiviensis]|uniref:Haemolysin activator HlyB C-terminal domain-containing protein n=1 Tax=Helicobacter valdiviensis TaxID=1458358 RepID=A0A2W6MTU7_9HELI|nr:ShlB/FhaC/HecB family hemolysin secretion/activation protein [Helicobacter valdiviensis]PZT47381.1 hypothetical protein B6S12_09435 [Helicobacter valdiviensis]
MGKKSFLALSLVGLCSYTFAQTSPQEAKQLEDMINTSPYRDVPQNKNITNTLRQQQNSFKQNQEKENLDEKGLQLRQEEQYKYKYNFKIDNKIDGKEITLKDLGIEEKWLAESIYAQKISKISPETLQAITNIVSYYFQYNGYPSATAYVPQQTIKDTIQVNIIVGTLGDYVVKNYSHLRDSSINSKLSEALKGKIITTKNMEDIIYKINQSAGIEAVGALEAGEDFGESNVVIEVNDSKKASAMLYADNYGTKGAGQIRFGATTTFNNLFGFGDSLNTMVQRSNENQLNYGATYTTFVGNLKISPRVNKGNYELGGNYRKMGAVGTSTDFGVDFTYPLFINSENSLYWSAGYTHRKLKDSYEAFGIDFMKHSDIGYGGFEGTYGGIPRNYLSYNVKVYYGDVVGDDELTKDSWGTGKFSKLNVYLNNQYYLHEKLTHIFNVSYQKVLGGFWLDSSESASLGGPYGMRAYRNGEGEGDNMVMATLGLRYQSPITNFYITPFYELGYSWNEEKARQEYFMDSAGLELLYLKPDAFYVKVDLARAIAKLKTDGQNRARAYIGAGIYF